MLVSPGPALQRLTFWALQNLFDCHLLAFLHDQHDFSHSSTLVDESLCKTLPNPVQQNRLCLTASPTR